MTQLDWWEEENMLKEPRNRTEKVFEAYNDYHDRGMVKWLTAFSMEELTRSISAGKEEALKDIPILNQMNTTEIDEVLAEALQKNRPVSIQLNQKDCLGRQTEAIVGHFRGYLAETKLLIDTEWILRESIRNIQILHEQKWSEIHVLTAATKEEDGLNSSRKFPNSGCIENQEAFDTDITWVEDFNQCGEWFD